MKPRPGFAPKYGARNVTLKRIVLVLTILGVIAQLQSRPSAQSQAAGEVSFKTLHQLMEEGIHEHFTFLSFTLWHDRPTTAEKMDAIAHSAAQLRRMAENITALRPRYLEAESMKDDQKAFDAATAQLSRSARMLAEAAARRDKARAKRYFDRLEASCRNCHTRFNKALANR